MATWTYFTAYLDGSRPVREAERNELLDNLAALLIASGCSGSGYTLNSTELTAVKSSGLITDRARLDSSGTLAARDRIETLISTASAAFSNYASARSTALSGEGISSSDLTDILNGGLDDYRLWNYYKRLIDALSCCTISAKALLGASPVQTCNRSGGVTVSPPTSNCACPFVFSTSGSQPHGGGAILIADLYVDFTATGSSKTVQLIWDGFGVTGNVFWVAVWNGTTCTTLLSTGCTTGSGSTTATAPAGTTRMAIYVTGNCNNSSDPTDMWSLVVTCS